MTISIKLTDYALKSIPGMSIKLPEEAVGLADGLVKIMIESKNSIDVFEKIKGIPLFNEIYDSGIEENVLIKANYLRNSKVDSVRSLTFKDQIYMVVSRDYLTRDREELLNTLPIRKPIEAVERMLYNNLNHPGEARKRLNLPKGKKE